MRSCETKYLRKKDLLQGIVLGDSVAHHLIPCVWAEFHGGGSLLETYSDHSSHAVQEKDGVG